MVVVEEEALHTRVLGRTDGGNNRGRRSSSLFPVRVEGVCGEDDSDDAQTARLFWGSLFLFLYPSTKGSRYSFRVGAGGGRRGRNAEGEEEELVSRSRRVRRMKKRRGERRRRRPSRRRWGGNEEERRVEAGIAMF